MGGGARKGVREINRRVSVASRSPMLRTLHGGSPTASLLFLQGGRGRRGGRRSFLALVLVVFNGSAIALLVLLVVIPLVLCSPGSTIGTWCSASPVRTRRSVFVVVLAVAYAELVLLVAPRAVFLPVVVYRPEMLGVMAFLDQKDSYAVACARLGLLVSFPRDVFLMWFRP